MKTKLISKMLASACLAVATTMAQAQVSGLIADAGVAITDYHTISPFADGQVWTNPGVVNTEYWNARLFVDGVQVWHNTTFKLGEEIHPWPGLVFHYRFSYILPSGHHNINWTAAASPMDNGNQSPGWNIWTVVDVP